LPASDTYTNNNCIYSNNQFFPEQVVVQNTENLIVLQQPQPPS